jgi:hypothetical protein
MRQTKQEFVNDGRDDLVCFFKPALAGFRTGDALATLKGRTNSASGSYEIVRALPRLAGQHTDGVDAPTSRSWRSGFLRKRSAPIEVVGAAHTLRLPTCVRQRVAATGTLIERKMQVRSLQRIADFCS